jgi:hypothetical protein
MIFTMSEEITPTSEKKICPKCSHEQPIEAKFCQKCGNSFEDLNTSAPINPDSGETQWRQVKKRITQHYQAPQSQPAEKIEERVCPNCKTVIESSVLEQCPLCMTILPPLPQKHKEQLDRMLFTGKKIVTEKEIKIDRNKWSNVKEILNVFLNSLLFFILVSLGGLFLQTESTFPFPFMGLLFLIGATLLGVYPIIYVAVNKLNWVKIGFKHNKIILYMFIGIISGVLLYFVNVGIDYLMQFLHFRPNTILSFFFNRPENLVDPVLNNNLTDLSTLEPLYFVIFLVIFLSANVMEVILFRGVIHNGIADLLIKKKSSLTGVIAIILTSLIYSVTFFVFGSSGYVTIFGFSGQFVFYELSGFMLPFDLAFSILIGIVYEITKRSLPSIIAMKIVYVGISILFIFIPLF